MKKLFVIFLFFEITIFGLSKLTEQDIKEIYSTYIVPNMTDEYKSRYVPLPKHKNVLPWRWERKDCARIFALLEFERFVNEYNISSEDALSINGKTDPEWYYLPTNRRVNIEYTHNVNNYDLHTLNLEKKDFDFVMVNQTLEHIYDPVKCLKNIYKHMKTGGILYFNVPANNIPHATPFHHYTGYTAVGIGCLLKISGFKILSIGQWGNLDYLTKMYTRKSWPDYSQISTTINDFNYPVIVWAFALKEN